MCKIKRCCDTNKLILKVNSARQAVQVLKRVHSYRQLHTRQPMPDCAILLPRVGNSKITIWRIFCHLNKISGADTTLVFI